jgi:regulator of protease activity HflC (stomatin/prohibitin superfamily)
MTQEELYRAQGLVLFRKAWVKPEVRDQVLQAEAQREAEDARAKTERAKLAEAQAQAEPRPAFCPQSFAPRACVQYYRNVGRDRPAYVHRYHRPYLYTTGANVLEIWPGAALTGP